MSVLRIMLFMLAAKITNQIQYFKSRVSADLGLFESESCIEAQLNTINNQNLLDSASLIVTPNAYKTNKLYSVVPFDATGDMTFIRATSATRVNAQGLIETVGLNIPRIDYSDGSCPSILVEPQRTNLFTRSEEFENNIWIKFNISIIQNTQNSPINNLTADTIRILVDTVLTRHRLAPQLPFTNNTTYTTSYYLKKANHRWIQLVYVSGDFGIDSWANFDLENGVIGNTGPGAIATITNVGNGWYRCTLRGTATVGGVSGGCEILTTNNTNSNRYPSYKSLIAEDVCYVWGSQLEIGSNATSYIPTTAATVTRNADVITKTSATNLIGQTEGTIFIKGYQLARGVLFRISNNSSTTDNIYFFCIGTDGRLEYGIRKNGVTTSNSSISFPNIQTNKNIVIKYSPISIKVFINGVLFWNYSYPSETAFTSILDRIDFGSVTEQSTHRSEIIALWKSQITDAQAIQLTTL